MKQTVPLECVRRELSFEWSHLGLILSDRSGLEVFFFQSNSPLAVKGCPPGFRVLQTIKGFHGSYVGGQK